MISVLITLTTAGEDTGPFHLYSDVDGYVTPFETSIAKASLEAGYISTIVPLGTTTVRVYSVNITCLNYIDLGIDITPTTTTTTTAAPTTTTTTTNCGVCWQIVNSHLELSADYTYFDCTGVEVGGTVSSGETDWVCSNTTPSCVSDGPVCADVVIIEDEGTACEPLCESTGI